MAHRGFAMAMTLALAFACRPIEKAAPPVGESTPAARTESVPTAEPEPAQPTPVSYRAVFDVPIPPPPTPVDVGAIPNFDRPPEPTPSSRAEQLARCLSFNATLDPTFSSSPRVRLFIRARNACAAWIPVEDSGFEVISRPDAGGGATARETGQFQSPIPPYSSHAQTTIEIDCPTPIGRCQYAVAVLKGS